MSVPMQTPARASRFFAWLSLARPANVLTAIADVLAGYAVAHATAHALGLELPRWGELAWLVLSTSGLYAGGVVLNDVFDAKLDCLERPERAIPSGRVRRRDAAVFGALLLIAGVSAAAMVSWLAAALAAVVAFLVVAYDAYAKHHPYFGPVNMGACRALNVLLGVSVAGAALPVVWSVGIFNFAYVAAITLVSRGEVQTEGRAPNIAAVVILLAVIAGFAGLTHLPGFQPLVALPFVAVFALRVLRPFIRAAHAPTPTNARLAVMAGVLSLIFLDAAIGAGFLGAPYGLGVVLLYPASRQLARHFAVT